VRDIEEAVDPYIERPMEVQAPSDNIDYWAQYPEAQMTPAFNQNNDVDIHEGVEVSSFSIEDPAKPAKVTTRLQEKREQLKKPHKKTIGKKPVLKKEFRKVNKNIDNQENNSHINNGIPSTPSFSVLPEISSTTNNFYNNNYTINYNNFEEKVTNIFIQSNP
jgi:hypothetical protein